VVAREPSGCFKMQDKPTATVKKEGEHYYRLTMGERVMGGTNKAALEAYARKQGFVVRALDVEPEPCHFCTFGIGHCDCGRG